MKKIILIFLAIMLILPIVYGEGGGGSGGARGQVVSPGQGVQLIVPVSPGDPMPNLTFKLSETKQFIMGILVGASGVLLYQKLKRRTDDQHSIKRGEIWEI